MKIHIEQIPEAGRSVRLDEQEWAVKAAGEALDGRVIRMDGELHLEATDVQIRVRGEAWAELELGCGRCGAGLVAQVGGDIDLVYVPAREVPSGALLAEDLEVGFYTDGWLELDQVVEEHFALSAPDRLACGLARVRLAEGARCAKDLLTPETTEQPVDSRFAALLGANFGGRDD